MIALPELHNLIKTLNKPEKRFFKLLAGTEDISVERSIQLFDHIEKVNDRDDIYYKVAQQQDLDVSPENLKNLFHLILKSQRSYYSETITGFTLSDGMANVKILFEKAQYKQCRKMLRSVKEKAYENEKFSYLLEIIDLEKKLLKSDAFANVYQTDYAELKKQKAAVVEQERNMSAYYRMYAKLRFQSKNNSIKTSGNKSFYTSFLNNEFLKFEKKALSLKARFLLLNCKALCFEGLHLKDDFCAILRDLKNFMGEHPLIFEEMPRQYIDVLYNLGYVYLEKKDFTQSKKIISEIQSLANSKKLLGVDLQVKLCAYSYNLQLLLLMYTQKINEAKELSEIITGFIGKNPTILNKEDKSVLFYNLTNFFIYHADFDAAARLLNLSKTGNDKNARWDLKIYSKIQELIICFEKNEWQKVILLINSLKALVDEKQLTTPTEKKFIACFNSFHSKPDELNIQKKFKTLYAELLKEAENDKIKRLHFSYFNFLAYTGYKAGEGRLSELITKNL